MIAYSLQMKKSCKDLNDEVRFLQSLKLLNFSPVKSGSKRGHCDKQKPKMGTISLEQGQLPGHSLGLVK